MDEVLVFVHHGVEGILYAVIDLAVRADVMNAGVGIYIEYGHAVGGKIPRVEEARDVALTGLPAVVYVVIEHVEPAVALGAVSMVAEGALHEVEFGIELIRAALGKGGIDRIERINVRRGGGGGPDIAVLALGKHLELQRAARNGGISAVNAEGMRIAHVEGDLRLHIPFGGGELLRLFRKAAVNVYNVGAVRIGGAEGSGFRVPDLRFDKAGHAAGRNAGIGACAGVVDHDVISGIAVGAVEVELNAAGSDGALFRLLRGAVSGQYRKRKERREQNAEGFSHGVLLSVARRFRRSYHTYNITHKAAARKENLGGRRSRPALHTRDLTRLSSLL